MPVSYPLDLPANRGIAQISMTMRNVVGMASSPFVLSSTQVIKFPGEAWAASIALPPMKRDEAEEWIAFLASLGGKFGTFLLGDPNAVTPQGSAAVTPGIPRVNGGTQTGQDLNIDGLPASAIGYLMPGDYIQIGSGVTTKLYKVLSQVNSNASGQATVSLWPSIRTPHPDNSLIIVNNCRGHFRLNSNEIVFSINEISTYGISFDCIEVV